MSVTPTRLPPELPDITRHDRARFVKQARQMRAAEFDRLFRSVRHGLARVGRALAAPVTASRSAQRTTAKF